MSRRIFREDHAQAKSSTADRAQEGADAIKVEVERLNRHLVSGADFLVSCAGNRARHGFRELRRNRPIAPRPPWQNGHCERLFGSIRRKCLDHVVVAGERHLRHLRLSDLDYYDNFRSHLALNKDAPRSRAFQVAGSVAATPVLGRLLHVYVRI